jgi:flagellar L-ring protein precursor FlgH
MRIPIIGIVCLLLIAETAVAKKKPKTPPPQDTTLDQTIAALTRSQESARQAGQVTGSLWSPTALFSDLAADLRARHTGDVITIAVSESTSAVSSGTVKTSRASNVQSSISNLVGITKATGPLANLANFGTTTSLNGQGTTTHDTTLTTTLSAVVTQVLPNGNLVIQGTRKLGVNSETQVVAVRGIVRPIDLDTTNTVLSSRIAQMEIHVDGKGVVADSIRRPNILYRILLGLLPF